MIEFCIYMILVAVVAVGFNLCCAASQQSSEMKEIIKELKKQSKYYNFKVSSRGGLSKKKKDE